MLVCVVLWCLFIVSLWSPAGKGLTSWLSCLLCVVTFPNVSLSTSEIWARLALWNWFKPSSKIFYWPFLGGTFVDHLCFLCLVFLMLLGLFIAALWSPAGKGLTSWLLLVMFIVFLFPMWYPGSGVVLDCIISWTLPTFLLLLKDTKQWCQCGSVSSQALYHWAPYHKREELLLAINFHSRSSLSDHLGQNTRFWYLLQKPPLSLCIQEKTLNNNFWKPWRPRWNAA